MVEIKKKRGRPLKEKSWVDSLRLDQKKFEEAQKKHDESVKQKSVDMLLAQYERRIATLELILENAVNAGRKLHEKFEALQKTHKKGWVPHDGDTQPVHNDSLVTVLLRNGDTNGPNPAWRFLWKDCGEGTIVAYKVD